MAKEKKSTTNSKADKAACIKHLNLTFEAGPEQETTFTRADLVFTGVDHSSLSYEVRVFLNNAKADDETPRIPETGYAGGFSVFGHGNCFGDVGHCEVPAALPGGDIYDQHPLTKQRMIVPITEALKRVLSVPGRKLETVTLVPISKAPRRSDRGLTANLFKYEGVSLRTYR